MDSMRYSSDERQIAALSPEARAVYDRLLREWKIEDAAGLLNVLTACQALERMRQAQVILAKEGVLLADRWGQLKPHPASQIEKESRAGLLQALKALSLDLEALQPQEDGIAEET